MSYDQQSIKLFTNSCLNIKFIVQLFDQNHIAFFKSKLIKSFKSFK